MSTSVFELSVVPVGPEEVGELRVLLRAIARERAPQDPEAAERASRELDASLACYDLVRSDASWALLARLGGAPAGYAVVCRIPKADARCGFLFVDELYVLTVMRRRGVARALLERVSALARELGLAGVRLLVRPENAAARALYRSVGFEEHETFFCQKEDSDAGCQ